MNLAYSQLERSLDRRCPTAICKHSPVETNMFLTLLQSIQLICWQNQSYLSGWHFYLSQYTFSILPAHFRPVCINLLQLPLLPSDGAANRARACVRSARFNQLICCRLCSSLIIPNKRNWQTKVLINYLSVIAGKQVRVSTCNRGGQSIRAVADRERGSSD